MIKMIKHKKTYIKMSATYLHDEIYYIRRFVVNNILIHIMKRLVIPLVNLHKAYNMIALTSS